MTPAPPDKPAIAWPHAPVHKLCNSGTYFVTGGTYLKQHFFAGKDRLEVLHRGLLHCAEKFGWQLEAWAVFSNHYHFVGHSPRDEESAKSLSRMLSFLHTQTATWVNRLDNAEGRSVWHNYWETELTFHGAYFARLNYVTNNPVKHGLVDNPLGYPWCSASWLELNCSAAQLSTLRRFKGDRVSVYDDFAPRG